MIIATIYKTFPTCQILHYNISYFTKFSQLIRVAIYIFQMRKVQHSEVNRSSDKAAKAEFDLRSVTSKTQALNLLQYIDFLRHY